VAHPTDPLEAEHPGVALECMKVSAEFGVERVVLHDLVDETRRFGDELQEAVPIRAHVVQCCSELAGSFLGGPPGHLVRDVLDDEEHLPGGVGVDRT
jgi:hypothetical protein